MTDGQPQQQGKVPPAAPQEPLLRVQSPVFRRGRRVLFSGLSLEVVPGTLTAVLGPNGAGKSTLLSLLAGLEIPESGQILLRGRPVSAIPRRELARAMAFLQQETALEFGFTVRELVALGRSPHQNALGTIGGSDERAIDRVIRETGLTGLENRDARLLSGGERRRVFLAQALVQEPQILLLDEPTAFLDLRHQALFQAIIARRIADGLAVIAVLHDPNQAVGASQVVLLSDDGSSGVGTPAEMLTPQRLTRLYGTPISTIEGTCGERLFVAAKQF